MGLLFAIAVGGVAFWLLPRVYAAADRSPTHAMRQAMMLIAKAVVADPAVPAMDLGKAQWDSVGDDAVFLRVEAKDAEQPPGGVVAQGVSVFRFDTDPPSLRSLAVKCAIRLPPTGVVDPQIVRSVADAFGHQHVPEFWRAEGTLQLEANQRLEADCGALRFKWRRTRGGLDVACLSVDVRQWDGKVVGVEAWCPRNVAGLLDKAAITAQAARSASLKRAANSAGRPVQSVAVDSVVLLPFGPSRSPSYLVQLAALDPGTGKRLHAIDVIDATTGRAVAPRVTFTPARVPSRHVPGPPADRWPAWTQHGLVFTTTRSLAGMPAWSTFPPQLALSDGQGRLFYLTADCQQAVRSVAAHPTSPRIMFQRGGESSEWTYSLDLTTGSRDVHGTGARPSPDGAVSWDGSLLALVAMRRSWANTQLVWDRAGADPVMTEQKRITTWSTTEGCPAFSPDGRWLYFATWSQSGPEGAQPCSVYRIPVSGGESSHAQPALVARGLPSLIRLAVFRDGRRLLASHATGSYVLDAATGAVAPVGLRELRDAALRTKGRLVVHDLTPGPGADEVTFSGRPATGPATWRIYSCRLDGTNLRRLTPLGAEAAVRPYVFPASRRSARDLAEDLALKEIAWEKAHPDGR